MDSGEIALVVVGLGAMCFLGLLAFLSITGTQQQPFALRQTPEEYFRRMYG